ncbi:SMP-30/gluconolactonase/LRE family protein [Paraburkholderia sp.]|uniref:SMP-30/gluconolactonase/LRE family protein n=1 Tax=Paraburkholderia sp. TaxID=1926495 RepID=UPI0025DE4DE7|nr:SMP-30/gluconolactonase/LRE family protein [Paraburkholderia sp.]
MTMEAGHTSARRLEARDARRSSVGECPVWREQENAFYWEDIPAQMLVRCEFAMQRRTEWHVPERIGCFAFAPDGKVLAALETGLFALTLHEPAPGETSVSQGAIDVCWLAVVAHATGNMRFNDRRRDRQGRFWAGTMVQDAAEPNPAGKLYRYTAQDGLSAPVVEGLCTQNGLAWSPDGRTMYLLDSRASSRVIWAAFQSEVERLAQKRRKRAVAAGKVGQCMRHMTYNQRHP